MSQVNASCDKNVLRITLSDPDSGNLLDDRMLGAILAALEQWRQVGVVLLDAQGANFSVGRPRPRASSGLDRASADHVRRALEMVHAVNMKLRDWPGAAVALLRGQARGAAAGFIMNCDVVLAEPGASLGFPEMTYDLPPALVASYLPNRITPRIAHYMLLTGAEVDVERALAWGLVHEIHAPQRITQRADELVAFLASRAPAAIDYCKRSLYAFLGEQHAVAGPRGIDLVVDWLSRELKQEKS